MDSCIDHAALTTIQGNKNEQVPNYLWTPSHWGAGGGWKHHPQEANLSRNGRIESMLAEPNTGTAVDACILNGAQVGQPTPPRGPKS
jgi:hypothetical protein